MTCALETYLHQIGLVADMLLPSSKPSHSDYAAPREDALASEHQHQQHHHHQQHQQPTANFSTRDASVSTATPRLAADESPIPANPVTTVTFGSGLSDSGPVSATVVLANYSPAGEPNYVQSTGTTSWSRAESNNRTVLVEETVFSRHQNAITTVTITNCPNNPGTKSSHQDPNITQVSQVTPKLSSSSDKRQTLVQCSANNYSLSPSVGLPQVSSQTLDNPTNYYSLSHSVGLPQATSQTLDNPTNYYSLSQSVGLPQVSSQTLDNPTNHYSLNHNVPQLSSHTLDIPATAYPVTQSVQVDRSPLATVHANTGSNTLNSKDITQHIHTNDKLVKSCPVDVGDVDRRSFESAGVIGNDLAGDNTLVISIKQNLNDIWLANQSPFDQPHFNHSRQSTAFTFKDHCSNTLPNSMHHMPAEDATDSIREEAERYDVVLSSLTDPSPPFSQSSSDPFQPESRSDIPGVANVEASESQPTIIKSSMKRASPKGVPKFVTFSTSDLVHVEEYTVSPATPPPDVYLPFERQLENISQETQSELFAGVSTAELWPPVAQENGPGLWFDSSTDSEPYLVDLPSPNDEVKDYAPLSFINDVFGRTTICVTSGTFRPGESGKLNGKTVSDLSGSQGTRRTLSAGTLSGIRSHRTLVKVNFIQGLLDINHNPGQTTEADSKAVEDSGSSITSTFNYCDGMLQKNLKNSSIAGFPRKDIAAQKRVEQKLCHKLSRYKYHLIAAILGVIILLSLAIGFGVGLRR